MQVKKWHIIVSLGDSRSFLQAAKEMAKSPTLSSQTPPPPPPTLFTISPTSNTKSPPKNLPYVYSSEKSPAGKKITASPPNVTTVR